MARFQLHGVPSLDLHPYCHEMGGDVDGALHAVRVFLMEQLLAGADTLEIVHGKGQGKLRARVHEVLEEYRGQRIIQGYEVRGVNTGSTVVYLTGGKVSRATEVAAPPAMQSKPFEALRGQFRAALGKPQPEAPLPPEPATAPALERFAANELNELERLARELVEHRQAAAAPPPPLALPRKARGPAPGAEAAQVRVDRDLEERAAEARQTEAPRPTPHFDRPPPSQAPAAPRKLGPSDNWSHMSRRRGGKG